MADGVGQEELKQALDRIWEEIRGSKLYAGQPRNETSARCVSLAEEGVRLATESGNERWLIESWRMMANSLTANEQFEDAIPLYKRAVERLDELGEHALGARGRLGYIAALFHAGRYLEALEVARTAEDWFRKSNDEVGFARLCTNMANLYHRLDDHMQAYRYHVMAAETVEKLGDQQELARCYLNLGNAHASLDSFDEADRMYEKSEVVSRDIGMLDLYAQANYNRAYLHYLRGRYSDALQSFAKLRQRFEQTGSRHYALCDLDEAEIYVQLNLSKDAASLALRAATRFGELGNNYEQAKAMAFYGVALIQMQQFPQAMEAFQAAQKKFEAEGNLYWMGLLDLYRAEVHFSSQRFWEAQSLATQAKATFERLCIPSKRIFSLVLLGRLALSLNNLSQAEDHIREISELVETSKIPLVLFPYYVLRAELSERMEKPDDAHYHYTMAAQELEHHQARLHHDDLRVTFFKGRQQAYDALVRLSLDHPDPVEALGSAYTWCERARSRGLVELMSHCAPAVQGHAEQSLLSKINRLREELNIYYARTNMEAQPSIPEGNFETMVLKEQELARSLREVSGVDPEYASLQQVSIATLESVREALPERTTLVEYFTAGDEVLAFVVTRDSARVVRRLCPASRILTMQERLGFQLEKFMLGPDYVQAHESQILEGTQRRLQELYRDLMAPFIEAIQTPHITIVPHGALHSIPFHAFYDGEKYLVDEYEISYGPSASVLKYCFQKGDVAAKRPVLVGVADEKAPLVEQEISTLSELFPDAKVLRDQDATRAAFSDSIQESSFLHIATHAIFRQDNPMFSSFKLGDGWFTAVDLFSMTCQTNLVTLSGCQSGVSEVTGSDDLLGLMRGFLYAGARSLLVSLWNVNDASTAALMGHFYREWQNGQSKSNALRSAMLSVRKDYPNPFYWAPFMLVGNP